MPKKKLGLALQVIILISVFLLGAYFLLGHVLLTQTKTALKSLIQSRMLDMAKTAAANLDGDILEKLEKEDKGTPEYQLINDELAIYQENIELEYIYCIRKNGEKDFTFTVDPTIEDPGEFGSPIVYTEALERASNGEASVDDTPYEDEWGKFYSAYSPVFDSQGKVAGIVAVDFSARWYDSQIRKITWTIVLSGIFSLLFGAAIVFVLTGRYRKRFKELNSELENLALSIGELTDKLEVPLTGEDGIKTYDKAGNLPERKNAHDTATLSKRIREMKENLDKYIEHLHAQANSMITALSSDYRSVYYIDLDRDEGVCYRAHSKLENGLQEGEQFDYLKVFGEYADHYVVESYRQGFLNFVLPQTVRDALLKEPVITYRYLVKRDGKESYEMLKMAGVRRAEDREDGMIHAIGAGFADVDNETRQTLDQSQALSDALGIAEEANRAKTAFLSSMSHEIRTPMNAIIGLNNLALNDPNISDQTRDYLEKIGDSANHLLKIINDILDMSRIEAGHMSIKSEPFLVTELIDQISTMIEGQCRDKNLRYICKSGDDIGSCYIGDSMRLKQVLINILGNAVKFTDPGGRVTFDIERTAHYDGVSTLRFTITDTGVGMDADYVPKLFDAFSQEDPSSTNKYGSTGLGMAITKNIVDMMNGTINVTSKKKEGTTFVVTLSLRDSEEQLDENAGTERSATDVHALAGKRILLAEDMKINAEILIMLLKSIDIEVDLAENGRRCVDMFREKPLWYYDAILMDIRMPEMDGLTATGVIRELKREDAKKLPIIALSANAFDEDVQRSLQAGLDAHLTKPIEQEKLFDTLERLLCTEENN